MDFNATPSELLKVGIGVNSISYDAVISCIQAIQTGAIFGRAAIFCISEIRMFLLSKSTFQCDEAIQGANTVLEHVFDVVMLCVTPFIDLDRKQSFLDDSISAGFVGLELVPVAIGILSSARKRFRKTPRYHVKIIDHLLRCDWQPSAVLPLSNMLCEIHPVLKRRHFRDFKVRLEGEKYFKYWWLQ